MRVLVTGATTPLGGAIVDALLASPRVERVVAVGRESRTEALVGSRSRLLYRSAELTRPRVLHDLLWGEAREHRIDVVIHAMHHRRFSDTGTVVHAQNVDATRELLLACRAHPTIQRLVYRSFAEVYALDHRSSNLLDEESPLNFDPTAPQWVRDRVEADVTVCGFDDPHLEVAVLRCAEILAPNCGSQLWDYLQSRVCLRPLGFDPMINVLSLDDAAAAFAAAALGRARGIFNIRGRDTLPLSSAIAASRRASVPVPGPLMTPLYELRRRLAGFEFRYDANVRRFHFGGVLDGTRARQLLGFEPHVPVKWPVRPWNLLIERLAELQRAS